MNRQMVYIAGPYRPTQYRTERQNVRSAEAVAVQVANKGHFPVTPHLNTAFFTGEGPDDLWLWGDLNLLACCSVLVLCEGWEDSSGAVREMERATELGLAVFHDVSDLPEVLDETT